MKNNKGIASLLYNISIYAGLTALLVYLYQADYLYIPDSLDPYWFVLSIFLAIAGFLCQPAAWHSVLRSGGYTITYTESLAAFGTSIFGKYIPGKIWSVIGRAGYSAKFHGWDTAHLSFLSTHAQLLTLWQGIAIGLAGVLLLEGSLNAYMGAALAFIIITLIIFLRPLQEKLLHVLSRGRMAVSGETNYRAIVSASVQYLIGWIFWCSGFYAMVYSLGIEARPVETALGFALAATIGIVSVFSPGGLGVREAVITGYLALLGISVNDALMVSVFSRVWFLIGEVSMFAMGVLADKRIKK